MGNEAGGLGLIWFAFVAWLMWSTKEQKEAFLFYSVVAMLGSGALYFLYQLIK